MKRINYLFFCLLLSAALVVGCKSDSGDDPKPSEEKEALAKLQGTWEVEDVTRDNGVPPVGDYSDMTLTISEKTFSTTGGPDISIFPNGEFTFVDATYEIINVDGVIINLRVDGDQLVTTFTVNDEESNARISGTGGTYTFTFIKVK